MTMFEYALEQLYADQDHDWVVDTIPAVLAWVPGKSAKTKRSPYRFALERRGPGGVTEHELRLPWDLTALARHDPPARAKVRRYRSGRSVLAEHLTEVAAYGLALVAISVFMPGRRVQARRIFRAPDLLFDATAGALRGVEVAGRSRGGRAALVVVRDTKRPGLLASDDLVEVHLSLWSGSPRCAMMEQVKP